MHVKRLTLFSSIFTLVLITKLLNLYKMFIIGKGVIYSTFSSNEFLFVMGITIPLYSIFESSLQASLIPFYEELKKKKFPVLIVIFLFILFSLTISFIFLNIFSFKSNMFLFFILLFLLLGAVFKVLAESEGLFNENYFIDLMISLIFIIGMFFRIDLLILFVFTEILRSVIKILLLYPRINFININLDFFVINPIIKNFFIILPGAFFSNIRGFLEYFLIRGIELGAFMLNFGSLISSGVIGIINISFSGILLKAFSDNMKDIKSVRKYRDFFFFNIIPLSIFVSVGIFFKGHYIVSFFVNKEVYSRSFLTVIDLIRLNSIIIPLFVIQIFFIRYYNSLKKNLLLTLISMFEIIINFTILYYFISYNGIKTIPLARILSILISILILFLNYDEKSFFLHCLKIYVKKVYILVLFIIFMFLFNIYINCFLWIVFLFIKRDYYVWVYRSFFKNRI